MFERPRSGERAVLVHVDFPGESDPDDLLEFTELVISAGATPVATITASRHRPEPVSCFAAACSTAVRYLANFV